MRTFLLGIVFGILLALPGKGYPFLKDDGMARVKIERIALFPIENLSGVDLPPDLIGRMREQLKRKGGKVISAEEVEGFLLRNRIRRLGGITRAMAKKARGELKADGVLICWVDLYDEGEPAIGLGARLVDTRTGLPVWTGYVALLGDDFTSFFKLGKVRSFRALADLAFGRLFADLDLSSLNVPLWDEKPFALRDLLILPKVTKGGEEVRVKVRLVGTDSRKPLSLTALLGDCEVRLRRGEWWEGKMRAPEQEGIYPGRVRVHYRDSEYLLDSANTLIVDNTPPKVRVSFENPSFSPNGDRSKDLFIFFPTLEEDDRIERWEFFLMGENGKRVKEFVGSGDLPLGLGWRGDSSTFQKAEEGVYFFGCLVEDEAGNVFRCPRRKVVLDRTPPRISVQPSIEGKVARLRISCEEENGLDQWRFFLMKENGEVILAKEGPLSPPQRLEVTLPPEDPGSLLFSLEVGDRAGNWTEVRGPLLKPKALPHPKGEERKKMRKGVEWDYDF